MEVVTVALLASLVGKIVTVIKAVGKDNNMAITQVLVWIVGIAVTTLAAQSDLAQHLTVGGGAELGSLNWASLILAGSSLGSGISQVYDFKAARDNNDTAAEPALIPSLLPEGASEQGCP